MTQPGKIDAYVINLDRSPERWAEILRAFQGTDISLIRVSGVDVSQMASRPGLPEFNENAFRRNMGREAMNGEIGCYLSHLKALRMFLETDASYAIIAEDDMIPAADLVQAVCGACRFSHTWEFVRLYKCRHTGMFSYARLDSGHVLCVALTDFILTAAYLVNRRGAKRLLERLACMNVPYDAALHHGWPGIREASLYPNGVELSEQSQQSTINLQKERSFSLPRLVMKVGYKFHSRLTRYTLQTWRILRWKCVPPVAMEKNGEEKLPDTEKP